MPLKSAVSKLASDAEKTVPGSGSEIALVLESRSNILRQLFGSKGGSVTSLIYRPEHFSQIAKKGWTGAARKQRLAKHRISIAKARAALAEIRAAKKKYGSEWVIGRFREALRKTGDPKAALRKIMNGA